VFDHGQEPDPRFTLANERTFLAWIRTALGLVVAGVAIGALAGGPFATAAAAALAASGVVVLTQAAARWARSERALRLGRPLPGPSRGWLVAAAGAAVGAAVVAMILP
jgi:putative membrane protein